MSDCVKKQTQSPVFQIMTRRTWVGVVCTIVLLSSWSLLKSLFSYHESNSSGWSLIYAVAMLGLILGLLSMAAALAVAVPAILVTWITLLVLLAFCGKSRKDLVVEGKKLSAEISGVVVNVFIKEGNLVAAVLGYCVLGRKNSEE